MREWDEMIARQVSADGVRTTWGEHVAPPGGEVTMTDDHILSAEGFDTFQVRTQADLDRLAASHEALRARLTAAEAQVAALTAERDEASKEVTKLAGMLTYWKGLLDRRSTTLFARAEHAERRVVTLTEALREAQQCLYRDGANAAGEVKALIDAALAAADQTDEGDK